MKPRFITFEGIDGSGKSTVAGMVKRRLASIGFDVVLTREPTDSWLGEAAKRSSGRNGNPFTDLFLFMADRADHTDRIKAWLKNGRTVLCDRYLDSTVAYQGATMQPYLGRNALNWLQDIHEASSIRPDITFFLRLDPETAMGRISGRSRRIKFEHEGFLRKVDKNYAIIARREKRFVTIDASLPVEEVVSIAFDRITNKMVK
jgi:dTMP kinase